MADDLSQLQSDEEILTTVSQRASAGLVFTRLGGVVLCLNPQRPVAQLYGREERLRHLRALDRQLPPHIYELGARALEAAGLGRTVALRWADDGRSAVALPVPGAGAPRSDAERNALLVLGAALERQEARQRGRWGVILAHLEIAFTAEFIIELLWWWCWCLCARPHVCQGCHGLTAVGLQRFEAAFRGSGRAARPHSAFF